MFHCLFAVMVILVGVVFRIAWSNFFPLRRNFLCPEGIVYTCRVGTKHDSKGEEFYSSKIRCLYTVKGGVYTNTLENTTSGNDMQWDWKKFGVTIQAGAPCQYSIIPDMQLKNRSRRVYL